MAMKMSADDPLMPHLRMISEAGERAKHLTDSLLVFSRKQTPKLSQVGINGVIEGMKKMTLRIIGEHIESRVRLSDEEMIVMGDSGLLEQVMLNLATNARDAMPGGGILTVETARMQMDDDFIHLHGFGEPGPYALITVSDNGQGMDRETREKIFEPFFTTKEVGRGTGLGLAIVYGIVKQLKGFINCYSEPGQGTTFRIYLPLAEAIETRAELKNMTEVQGGGETILIADDDQHVRSLTRELIEHFGYTVIEAVDGADAVRQFDKNRGKIDLLVLDVIMPKKNGREVLDEIRLQQPNVKAIFLSGYSADIVSDKGSSGAGADLLLKPVIPHLLMQRIREVLDS
jgi:CheY-like chemotaxis protein/two-component sensor histidine kinase